MKISKFGAIQYFMGQSLIWEGLLWFALGHKVRIRVGLGIGNSTSIGGGVV